jgi:hypothetical protein
MRRGFAHGGQDGNRIGLDPPGDEPQQLRRRLVKPLGVVDGDKQRPLASRFGEQRQHRQPDQKRLRGRGRDQPGDRSESVPLWRREAVHVGQERYQQLMRGGEPKPALGFDARDAYRMHARGLPDGVLEQCRLAGTRLAALDEAATGAPTGTGQQPVDCFEFLIVAEGQVRRPFGLSQAGAGRIRSEARLIRRAPGEATKCNPLPGTTAAGAGLERSVATGSPSSAARSSIGGMPSSFRRALSTQKR